MAEVDGGDILIRIRGDASDLEDAINRSQGAISGLESGADDAADVLGDMGSAAKKTKVDLKSLSGEGISAVAAGLSAVNPQAGALVGLFGQLRVLSGPLAVVLGGVTAAMMLNTQHQEEMIRLRQISRNVADEMAAAELRLRDAHEANLLAAGKVSAEEMNILQIRRQSFIESLPQIEAINAALAEQIRVVEKRKGDLEDLNENQRNFNQLHALAVEGLAEEQQELERIRQQRDSALATLRETVNERVQEIRTIEAQAVATQTQADALRNQAKANRDLAMAEAALQRQRDNQRKKDQADQDAADRREEEKQESKRSKEEKDQRAAADRQAAIDQGIRDSLSATADLSMTLSSVISENNIKAARRLHRLSQAASLTQVAMNTSVAIVKALAELGPVAGGIAAAGIGLTGAAQAAAIAAHAPPSAHIGTGMPGSRDPLAPDERMSRGRRVLTTEASGPGGVLNSMGTQLINDVNTGRVQSSGRITAVIGRSHLDQELFRSGRRGTSRYARSLRTNPHPKPQGGY